MCNIKYEDGKYCEKCGSDLEEIVEAQNTSDSTEIPAETQVATTDVQEENEQTSDSVEEDSVTVDDSTASKLAETNEDATDSSQNEVVVTETANKTECEKVNKEEVPEPVEETNDNAKSEETNDSEKEIEVTGNSVKENNENTDNSSQDDKTEETTATEEPNPELTPKEAKQKAKEEKKKAKEEAKKAKEDAKKQKQEEKAAKVQAKLDKKQAQIDAKIKKQEEKEAKAKAKAEKKAAKAEKKANRKFKKTRKVLWALLFIIIIVIALFAWYLGHSQIDNQFEKGSTNINTVLELIANDDDFDGKIKIDYDIFNNVINEAVDFEELDVISMATIENGYFSKEDKKFVLTLHSTLGRTSLLLDAETELNDDKIAMTLDNARLGYLHLIIPSSLANLPIEQSIDIPEFVWVKIDDIDLKKDAVELEYTLNIKKINNDFKALNIDVEPELLTYLTESGINLPASDIIFKAIKDDEYSYTEEDVYGILKAFAEDGEDIVNWTLVVPENLQDDFITISNIIVGADKTKEALKKTKDDKKKLLKDFDEFVNDEKESALRDASKMAFKNLKDYHTDNGFPAYYYGDKGKVFSQTLHEFLDLEDVADKLPESNNFELYAQGDKAILAAEVGKEIWYIKEGSNKIKKEAKKKFFKSINYDENKEYTAMLPEYDMDIFMTFAETIFKKEGYNKNEDQIEMRYLAYDDRYAIAVASLYNEPEIAPKYYLVKNIESSWKVIDIFDDTQKLGDELLEEIKSGEISPQLLPKYEMCDFERGFLKTAGRKAITKELKDDEKIKYYTMVDNNIFIIVENEDGDAKHYIMPDGVDGDMIEMNKRDGLEAYIKELSGTKEYKNYKPEFMFNQLSSFFSE